MRRRPSRSGQSKTIPRTKGELRATPHPQVRPDPACRLSPDEAGLRRREAWGAAACGGGGNKAAQRPSECTGKAEGRSAGPPPGTGSRCGQTGGAQGVLAGAIFLLFFLMLLLEVQGEPLRSQAPPARRQALAPEVHRSTGRARRRQHRGGRRPPHRDGSCRRRTWCWR